MVAIGMTRARCAGDLFEREGGQTRMPEQRKHELADEWPPFVRWSPDLPLFCLLCP